MLAMYPNIRVRLDDGAYLPERAHETDAGADIRTPIDVRVPPHGSAVIHSGVHVELPRNTRGDLVPKSGLNVKHDILSFGLIDEGYSGEIVVKLYNLGEQYVKLNRGDKVTQLVVSHVCYPEYEQSDEISAGPRGENGFGSTNVITKGPRP